MRMLWTIAAAVTGFAFGRAALAAAATITVAHDLHEARPAEIIAIPFEQIQRSLPDARMYHLVVRDERGAIIPSQVTNYEHDHRGIDYDDLVFNYDFAAGEKTATFTLEQTDDALAPYAPRVYARFVPERYDDFAWENDRIAHRIYGAALNSPAAGTERLRGSGIDIWGKRVSYLIVDRWYAKGHDQFHKDDGEGFDLYSVGSSRGAGGSGVWDGKKLYTSDNFAAWRVLANGPLRAVFEIDYAPWEISQAQRVAETKRFTVDAGRNLHAVESTYTFDSLDEITIGLGITRHAEVPVTITHDPAGRWISSWEEGGQGGLGIAIVLWPDAESAGFAAEPTGSVGAYGNELILAKVRSGHPLRYFAGAGWQRSGQFASRKKWEQYVQNLATRLGSPLRIAISRSPANRP